MKAIVTCDDVFEILTRGPFPTGAADDEAVEIHLAGCHECRQLAEALRPAVSLFHEAMEEQGTPLPAYRGRLRNLPPLELAPPPRVFGDEESILNLPVNVAPPVSRWQLQPETAANLVRFAASTLLGVALCLIVWTLGFTVSRQPAARRVEANATYSAGPLRLGARTTLALAAIPRPDECRSNPVLLSTESAANANARLASAPLTQQACCSRCHAAAHPGVSCSLTWHADCQTCHRSGPPQRLKTRDVSLQQQTCQVCHDG